MPPAKSSWVEVLAVFTRLGLTSFGGPVAHLAYFREAFVLRRAWLSDAAYADLVALAQFLPGPTSSQVGFAIGHQRAGLLGGLAAWVGFTLPSAVALVAFAWGVQGWGVGDNTPWLSGFKLVAVAVVAHAVWGMAQQLTPDRPRITIALLAAMAAVLWTGPLAQVGILLLAALVGSRWLQVAPAQAQDTHTTVSRRDTVYAKGGRNLYLLLFALLLLALPLLSAFTASTAVAVADRFYRAGSLVFGGGHVVLPLLHSEMVSGGWVDNATFLAGYGAAQAVPGPLFSFAAFLGMNLAPGLAGVGYAAVALVSVFLPSLLLLLGILPHWQRLRQGRHVRRALSGVGAAVVGLLLAALYTPVWASAVRTPVDVAWVLLAYLALAVWRLPPWLVVAAGGAGVTLQALLFR